MNPESTTRPQIRVLIVDDSAFMRIALARMIASDPALLVAGTACSGSEALDQIVALDPDVITLDVAMPGIDGLETLRRIMAQFPRPVIMVSSVTEKDAESTFTALAAGAFDYVPKQLSSTSLEIVHIQHDLIAKIKAAVESRLQHSAPPRRKPPQAALSFEQQILSIAPAIVAIGTSTGGPQALQQILPLFPRDLAVPILIVQHMPPGFTAAFAQRLNSLCSVPVREAAHHDPVLPGVVYIGPAGIHMTVERPVGSRPLICLTPERGSLLHIPSVNILMQSVAATFHSLALGVIMTGMGDDGSTGMAAIHREGGLTIGQDEASCVVYGMPRVCAELGILNRIVPLAQIPEQILQATRYRMHA